MKFTMVGDKEFKKKIVDIYNRAKNPVRAMEAVSVIMARDVKQHFNDEQGEKGRWKDLKPKTWEWKKEHGYTNMLRNSGNLWNGNLPEHDNDTAKVVNRMPYAETQNFGNGKVPARDFMWLSRQAMNTIINKLEKFVVEGAL